MKLDNAKTILTAVPRAFRELHHLFGFDFERNIEIVHIPGNFTVNRISKFLCGRRAVILMRDISDSAHMLRSDRNFHVAELTGGKVEIDFRTGGSGLDHFCRKADFESMRKRSTADSYLILQSPEHLILPKPEEKLNPLDRYIPNKDQISDGKIIYGPLNLRRAADGKAFRYGSYSNYSYRDDCRTLSKIIDRSGYPVRERQEELRRRAAHLRKEREKAAYLQKDDSGLVEELRILIHAKKLELCDRLRNAVTSDEIKAVADALDWRGLYSVMLDFEIFQTRTETHAYNSIAESDRSYQSIRGRLTV